MKKRLILLLLSCVILLSGCIENPYDRDDDDDEDETTISSEATTDATTRATTEATTVPTTAETIASTAETTVDPNAVVIGGITLIYDYEDLSHADDDATVLMTASLQNVTVSIAG